MLVEDVLHRLEEAWHSETDPQIEEFTAGLEPSLLDPTIVECIKVDLEYRWRTMRPVFLETYFERWPHLADTPSHLLDLLESECATRAVFSMPATADELARRFPAVAGQIDLTEVARQAQRDRAFSTEEESVAEQGSLTKPLPPRENATPVYLPLTMGQTFGRYKIRGQLGEGGEGNVYRAYDRQMDRDVALKFPRYADTDVFERFLHQSKVAAKLEHRNICRVYDAGTIGGVHFIAMALIRGATIQQTLEEHGPFDYETDSASDKPFVEPAARHVERWIDLRD